MGERPGVILGERDFNIDQVGNSRFAVLCLEAVDYLQRFVHLRNHSICFREGLCDFLADGILGKVMQVGYAIGIEFQCDFLAGEPKLYMGSITLLGSFDLKDLCGNRHVAVWENLVPNQSIDKS